MIRAAHPLVLAAALLLGGCAGASRFGDGFGSSGSSRIDNSFGRSSNQTVNPTVTPAPGGDLESTPVPSSRPGSISSEPLAPIGGSTAPLPAPTQSELPAGTAPVVAPAVPSTQTAAIAPSATAEPAATAPAASSAGGNTVSRISGTWTVTDAGDKCRLTLTSQPLFEYYRASAGGCKSASFAKVNAWESRGNEVVLLEPGGKVAARLFPQGDGRYTGATARGASVVMSR